MKKIILLLVFLWTIPTICFGLTVTNRYVNPGSSGGDGTTSATSGATAAYASLNAAFTDIFTDYPDLVTSDVQIVINCAGSTADTTVATLNQAFTVSSTQNIVIVGNAGATYDATKYHLSPASVGYGGSEGCLYIGVSYTEVKNIQVSGWETSTEYQYSTGINIGAAGVSVHHNIVCNPASAQTYYYKNGIQITWGNSSSGILVYRNIVYGLKNYRGHGIRSENNTGAYIIGNTVYNVHGATHDNNTGFNVNYVTMLNNIAVGCGDQDFLIGANMVSNNYNASSDDTATGANSINTATTADFVNVGAGTEDLRLASGADEIDIGTASGSPYNVDIDGTTVTGTYDIGADEYEAGSSASGGQVIIMGE